MRKLKLQVQISADGYIAETDGKTDWMVWDWSDKWSWDDELKKHFNNTMESVDCILLSRKMAEEGFITHWTKAAENQNDVRFAFAKKVNETRKVVFTKTLAKSEWENVDLAIGDLTEEVNYLKAQEGKDIIVYGGANFVSNLIKHGLIDEYHLFINPTALGSGMSIFTERTNLKLVKSQAFDCGIVVLTYKQSKYSL